MGDRGTEDGHDAVADVPVDVPAVLLDDPVDAVEEAPDEGVDLLGVELVAQRRVAGEIGEEHRDLPPLSLHCERGRYRCSRDLLRCPDMQGGDGVDQLRPMSERQAKLFKVPIPECRQDIAANSVVAERLLVLLQAEAPQPGRDIHYLPLPSRTRVREGRISLAFMRHSFGGLSPTQGSQTGETTIEKEVRRTCRYAG